MTAPTPASRATPRAHAAAAARAGVRRGRRQAMPRYGTVPRERVSRRGKREEPCTAARAHGGGARRLVGCGRGSTDRDSAGVRARGRRRGRGAGGSRDAAHERQRGAVRVDGSGVGERVPPALRAICRAALSAPGLQSATAPEPAARRVGGPGGRRGSVGPVLRGSRQGTRARDHQRAGQRACARSARALRTDVDAAAKDRGAADRRRSLRAGAEACPRAHRGDQGQLVEGHRRTPRAAVVDRAVPRRAEVAGGRTARAGAEGPDRRTRECCERGDEDRHHSRSARDGVRDRIAADRRRDPSFHAAVGAVSEAGRGDAPPAR